MDEISLIIGTHSYLLRTTLHISDEPITVSTEVIDQGHFGGIDFDEDGRIIAARRRHYEPIYDGWTPFLGDSVIYRYVDDEREEELCAQLYSVHQIRRGHFGWYVVETGRNHLLHFDDDFDNYHEWIFDGTAVDVNHPNCVEVVSEDAVAVMLHNHGRKTAQIEFIRIDEGFDEAFRLDLPHDKTHDFEFHGSTLYYLASDDGKLVQYDCNEEEIVREVEIGGFCKGMDRIGNLFIVGSSPTAERELRSDTPGKIALVDTREMAVYGRFNPLGEEACGNINEIRLTPDDRGVG